MLKKVPSPMAAYGVLYRVIGYIPTLSIFHNWRNHPPLYLMFHIELVRPTQMAKYKFTCGKDVDNKIFYGTKWDNCIYIVHSWRK